MDEVVDTLVPEDLVVDGEWELLAARAGLLEAFELVPDVDGTDVDGTRAGLGSLDALPVGAGLGWALERIVAASCDPDTLVAAAGAFRRQIAHLEAGFLQVVEALSRTAPYVLDGIDPTPLTVDQRAELAVGCLELQLGWSRYRADRVVGQAQTLAGDAPQTLAALADGALEADAARMIADTLVLMEDARDRRAVDAAVAGWARGHAERGVRRTWSQVRDKVTRAALAADPQATRKRHEKARADRDLQLRPGTELDSVADLHLLNLDPHEAATAYSRIDAAARIARTGGDDRTLAQLRADCALGLLAGTATLTDSHQPAVSTPEPAGPAEPGPAGSRPADEAAPPVPAAGTKARIQLDAPLTTYLQLAAHPGMLAGFGPIAPTVVRHIVDLHAANPDADHFLGVTHPRTGRLLSLHPVTARFFRGRRRDTLLAVDRTCAWPTCTRPSTACHTDHQDGYAETGTTDPATGQPTCPPHHLRTRHRYGWQAHRDSAAGTTTWTSPHGHTYTDRPDPPPF